MKDKIMFVRTKDNRIIEVENEKHLCSDNEYRFQYKGSPALIRESNVIKSSDNVEDLCDEFIHQYEDSSTGITRTIHTRHFKSDVAEAYKNDMAKGIIYGAIWTDKGLIYVAKMNDKGEWELL